jgi:hypothetical protein
MAIINNINQSKKAGETALWRGGSVAWRKCRKHENGEKMK